MFVSGTASAGVILHEELSTDERPAQPAPRASWRPIQPLAAASLHPTCSTSGHLSAVAPCGGAVPAAHGVAAVLRAHAGKGTLPPPAVWRELVAKASGRYGLDPRLIAAVIKVESNFETIAESEKGAQGLMQLMPGTQQMLGVIDPFDPEANVDAGSRYLRQQIDRFGRLDLALAAYNAGPGNVLRYGHPAFAETQAYVSKVLSLLDADN
ncbi:MAG: lytic transglycosylase domain-containing protein [Bilophila wadsworthia]